MAEKCSDMAGEDKKGKGQQTTSKMNAKDAKPTPKVRRRESARERERGRERERERGGG